MGGWGIQGRTLLRFGAKAQKIVWVFIVFPHENVLNKNQFEGNKSRKYTSASQWSMLLLDFQQTILGNWIFFEGR